MLFLIFCLCIMVTILLGGYFYIVSRKEGHSYSYLYVKCYKNGRKISFLNFFFLFAVDKGFLALLFYRISYRIASPILGKIISRITEFLTGIEIYYNAVIGKRVEIWHGNGVVIGQSAVIGDDCIILQQVTIGGGFVQVGNHCKFGAGAKVLGNISLGKHVVVGANSVVSSSVNSFSFVGGVPARKIKEIESSDDIVFGTKSGHLK